MAHEIKGERWATFPFNPKDFLSDSKVKLMNSEVRGIYITLLCVDWIENGLPADKKKWLTLGDYFPMDAQGRPRPAEEGNQIINQLDHCFVAHPDRAHRFTNPRLQREREIIIQRVNQMVEGGKKG